MDRQIYDSKFSHWSVDHIIGNGIVDVTDAKIIDQLLLDSRQSTQQIADKVGIKRTTCHERLKKLTQQKIIDSFTMKLNLTQCGLPLRAFILVSFDAGRSETFDQRDIARRISRLKYVVSVDIITGNYDFFVRVATDYMQTLSDLILDEIKRLPGVTQTQTLLSFEEYRGGNWIKKE